MDTWGQLNLAFEQQLQDENGNTLERHHGILQTQAPDKLRWETRVPHSELVVLNGNGMWHYQADLEQANYSEAQHDSPIYMLLRGDRDALARDYHIEYIQAGQYTLHARSGETNQGYTHLKVVLTQACQLRGIEWRDELDQKFYMRLRKNKHPIKQRAFIFKPPKGVDVYGR